MASEKPLSSILRNREFCIYCKIMIGSCTCNNQIRSAMWSHAVKSDISSAVEKEHNLLIKLHDDLITWDEFWIKRHEILGSFE